MDFENAIEYEGDLADIFRFDVSLAGEHEIEIGVTVSEIDIEGNPEFGKEYGRLAHLFAELIVPHIGMNTESFMAAVSDLEVQDVTLTREEEEILAEGDDGAVLLYSFPVVIMENDSSELGEGLEYDGEQQLGVSFEKSPLAQVMTKLYGEEFEAAEEFYCECITDEILDHGTLFTRAVATIQAE